MKDNSTFVHSRAEAVCWDCGGSLPDTGASGGSLPSWVSVCCGYEYRLETVTRVYVTRQPEHDRGQA